VCAHDASPLLRLVAATADLPDEAVIVRVDGLHFGFFPDLARRLADAAASGGFDLVKAPDDYPIQLTVDVYRVGALRRLAADAGLDPAFHIHPKYAMLARPQAFSCLRLERPPVPDDAELTRLRRFARAVYDQERLHVVGEAIPAGDQWRFHYDLALPLLRPGWTVLDAACGHGYGTARLAERVGLAVGIDLSEEALASLPADLPNLAAVRADVTRLPLAAAAFDAVVSFETIEHVDAGPYLAEMERVLKPGGLFVLSTPQNSLGHIPINSGHVREYSLAELTALLAPRFTIEGLTGIKQGRIVVQGDPIGQNTVAVCRKARRQTLP
jgi:2-polyprenyl-3-methyl-5-hydroxy-6-metoxy-1,4-benzoquinol methylase